MTIDEGIVFALEQSEIFGGEMGEFLYYVEHWLEELKNIRLGISEISKQNADKLGAQTSLWQTQEECGELIKAIGKYNRTRGYGQITETTEEYAKENLIEEIADVSICIEQLAYLLRVEEQVKIARNIAFNKVKNRYISN